MHFYYFILVDILYKYGPVMRTFNEIRPAVKICWAGAIFIPRGVEGGKEKLVIEGGGAGALKILQ